MIAQVVSASISLLASLTMAIFIAWPKNGGWKTPYRRIIFGLSISDVFQSFALVSGPWSLPSWIDVPWARGNEASCQANGVFLTFGQTALPMYTCFICLYYLCKLKYRMNDEEFKYKIEWKVHTFIVLYNIIVTGSALFLKIYNSTFNGSFCHFATTPLGCRFFQEIVGECDASTTARVDLYIFVNVIILVGISLSSITVMMVMLYKHANFMKKINGASNPGQRNQPQTMNDSEGELGDIQFANKQGDTTQMEQHDDISKIYQREVTIHATLYVGVFIITYMPMAICILITTTADITVNTLVTVIYYIAVPLWSIGGLFNILVYARPKVVVLQRNHPECSKLKCLYLVLLSGGEIPDDLDESICNKCCSSSSCQESNSVLDRFYDDETASKPTYRTLRRRAKKFENINAGCAMTNKRHENIEIDQSKVEGELGVISEENYLHKYNDITSDILVQSDFSLSRVESLDSSMFSLSTKSPDSFSHKDEPLKTNLESAEEMKWSRQDLNNVKNAPIIKKQSKITFPLSLKDTCSSSMAGSRGVSKIEEDYNTKNSA